MNRGTTLLTDFCGKRIRASVSRLCLRNVQFPGLRY